MSEVYSTLVCGMYFDEVVPDVGSIRGAHDEFTLLNTDVDKLNTVLVKSYINECKANAWNVKNGAIAVVCDYVTNESYGIYIYHSSSDRWYPIYPNEVIE